MDIDEFDPRVVDTKYGISPELAETGIWQLIMAFDRLKECENEEE